MMTSISVSGGGYDFSVPSIGGQWSWTVIANNVQGANQTYQFMNINTPYGSLYTAAIPIPGDVVTRMAESLGLVQQQLMPLLRLLSPSPAVFNITVTEGASPTEVGEVILQNVGAFGSFMSISATQDVSWLASSPSTASSISMNQSSSFTISLNPGTLLATGSPYTGHINFQDNRNLPTIIPVTVNVTVNPRPVISADPDSIILTYASLTKTPSAPQEIHIVNAGFPGSRLDFTLSSINGVPWLSFSPLFGESIPSSEYAVIVVSLVPAGVPLEAGVYSAVIQAASPTASNPTYDITVTLIVS